MYRTVIVMALCGPLMAGAQSHSRTTAEQSSPKKQTMDLSKITHQNVRKAIEALQAGDKSWYSFFTDHPVMTDDGNTVDFKSFFGKALGNEKFLSIDKVEEEGRAVYGNFKAGSWGTFKVFFKFHEGAGGKFDRLDIGQAKY